jgi:hypothetical protein
MKYLKRLGFFAVVMTAFVVFASSASADVLCKLAPNKSGECSTASGDYAANTTFRAEAANFRLTTVGGFTAYVSCADSKIELKNTATGSNTPGSAVPVEFLDLTFTTDCTTAGGLSCTISTTKDFTGTLKATGDVGGSASMHLTGSAIGIKMVCGGLISCEYSLPASGVTLDVTGGNPLVFKASKEPLVTASSGFGCSSEATWDADYSLAAPGPTALWVATKLD